MLRLLLVRHGQTDANRNHFLQGQSDGVLNATGIQQAEALGRHLRDVSIDRVISSPLRRAQATAAAVARYHDLEVQTSPLIQEWNCGSLDGITAELFRKKLQAFDGPLSAFRPEGGETLMEVRQRAEEFLNDLMAYQGETVLVCSHGDFLRALLSVLQRVELEQTSGIFFENASYTILDWNGEQWNLVALSQLPPEEEMAASGLTSEQPGLQVE